MKAKKNHKRERFIDRHSSFILLAPYGFLFVLFIIIPVLASIFLSFTYFNTIEPPKFNGLENYITLFTNDAVFMQKVLPNTVLYAVFVGIGGYILSFLMAWSLAQLTKVPRMILTVILYSPSMTGGILLSTVWGVIFNGDKTGLINYLLLSFDIINEPVQWLQSTEHLMTIMILVSLWSSMGLGFLAILSAICNVNEEIYEAAYIDGIKNRFQEIIYITIPSIKPQMMFGAVMTVVGTFQSGGNGVALSGANPTPGYAGQLLANHIDDYGFIRYEMGYAAAISVMLLLLIYILSRVIGRLFDTSGE